ncbi:MAG: hypothetical protein IJC39_05190 [Firmicutes bacterium]|nr:hypothetical protein [Bacillota bacterium]
MKRIISISVFAIIAAILCIAAFIHFSPVSRDAGACSGGYATYIFDKYNGHFVEKYLELNPDVASLSVSRDTADVKMSGRELCIEFDVQYKTQAGDSVTQRVRFIGLRYWTDSFTWGQPIVIED